MRVQLQAPEWMNPSLWQVQSSSTQAIGQELSEHVVLDRQIAFENEQSNNLFWVSVLQRSSTSRSECPYCSKLPICETRVPPKTPQCASVELHFNAGIHPKPCL